MEREVGGSYLLNGGRNYVLAGPLALHVAERPRGLRAAARQEASLSAHAAGFWQPGGAKAPSVDLVVKGRATSS